MPTNIICTIRGPPLQQSS